MVIVCSWCKKWMGQKSPFINASITHTICNDCKKIIRERSKENDSQSKCK